MSAGTTCDTVQITEGRTRLLVPAESLRSSVPPRHPAFFNPRAERTRDMTLLACMAHAESGGPSTYLDAMAGTGARSLRVATETDFDDVYINDANPAAVRMARRGAALNGTTNTHFSNLEACAFLAGHSGRGTRGFAVDVDPFGSPAPYMDCALRATRIGGMLAVTATDLQVLGGLHNEACLRLYGGVPVRAVYGAETALRLVLGCMAQVAGRLGAGIKPLYVESHMHYCRAYARLLRSPEPPCIGYVAHCASCGARNDSPHMGHCSAEKRRAGPLWIKPLFEPEFVDKMMMHNADAKYAAHLEKCRAEATLPAAFYTLDEIASAVGCGPPSLLAMIGRLRRDGYAASPTSFSPTGFRTDASVGEVCDVMARAKNPA